MLDQLPEFGRSVRLAQRKEFLPSRKPGFSQLPPYLCNFFRYPPKNRHRSVISNSGDVLNKMSLIY